MLLGRRALIAGLAAAGLPYPARAAESGGVLELRRCTVAPGVEYGDVEALTRRVAAAQTELGGQLLGALYADYSYAGLDQPSDEFVWLFAFPDLSARDRAYRAFASAPEWAPLRAMMHDTGKSLLLRPRIEPWTVPEQPDHRLYTVMIHDLAGVDAEAFAAYFRDVLTPRLEKYRIHPFGACLGQAAPHGPSTALPRTSAFFVWFAQWTDPAQETYLSGGLWSGPHSQWSDRAPPELLPVLKRDPEHLILFPIEGLPVD